MATVQPLFDIDARQFVPSQEVAEVAERVVDRLGRQGEVGRLFNVRRAIREGEIAIAYLLNVKPFDPTADEVKHDAIAKCIKAPTLWRDLTGHDVVIWARSWFWEQFTDEQRDALLLHELLHLDIEYDESGEIKLGVRKHDLEEFTDVAQRFGGALPGIDPFVRAFRAWQGKKPAEGGFTDAQAAAARAELDLDGAD
jgi:hypothetical protein